MDRIGACDENWDLIERLELRGARRRCESSRARGGGHGEGRASWDRPLAPAPGGTKPGAAPDSTCRSQSSVEWPTVPRSHPPATLALASAAFGSIFLKLLFHALASAEWRGCEKKVIGVSNCEELLLQWSLIFGYAPQSPFRVGRHVGRRTSVKVSLTSRKTTLPQTVELFYTSVPQKRSTCGDHFLRQIEESERNSWRERTWIRGVAGVRWDDPVLTRGEMTNQPVTAMAFKVRPRIFAILEQYCDFFVAVV